MIITKRPTETEGRWRAMWAYKTHDPIKGTGAVWGWTWGDTRADAIADAIQYIDPDGDRTHGIVDGH